MTASMFHQFWISTLLVLVCVMVHGFGLFRLNRALRSEAATEHIKQINPVSPRGVLFTFGVVLLLVALHGTEIWLFAMTYLIAGAQPTLEQSLYVSTISYSTVGFNDALIGTDWRLLTAFESILGVIMLGWSTAFLIRVLGRIDPH
jgi:high-affinity Fe2+/Pb2+ permease